LEEDLLKISTSDQGPKPGQKSLVIVFDNTGSMWSVLEQLRVMAKKIVNEITKRADNPIYNYIFVWYNDPGKTKRDVTTY
jgi:hypothetical protein